MPRKNPVPENELAICRRVYRVRLERFLGRAAFARQIGITAHRLSSYEHGRVPVPYIVGRWVCEAFNVNQRWLATGEEPSFPNFPIASELEAKINFRARFSAMFDEHLHAEVHAQWVDRQIFNAANGGKLAAYEQMWPRLGGKFAEWGSAFIQRVAGLAMVGLEEAQTKQFAWTVVKIIEELKQGVRKTVKLPVDTEWSMGYQSAVAELKTMQSLLEAVKAKASFAGVKSALAEHLGVTRQAVDRYLSGKSKPSGDVAIRMLAWVTAEEAKQNGPASAQTPAEPKTQSKGQHHGNTDTKRPSRRKR